MFWVVGGGAVAAVGAMMLLVVIGGASWWFLSRGSAQADAGDAVAAVEQDKDAPAAAIDGNAGENVADDGNPERKKIKNTSGKMEFETLKRVKSATLYLRVTLADGSEAEGSGFFGVEKGLVLTNAHVLGMLKKKQRPRRIEIVYHSGEADSRKFRGTILGVDANADLAVLRVTGENLPKPLRVAPSKDLFETQQVYIFGFPFGAKLGRNITVSQSSVSSLRKDPVTGILKEVQVNGGMNPGNSGGPVVNTDGEVIGVAVAVILGTQINFAIPGDFVKSVLDGRIERPLGLRTTSKQNGQTKVAVNLRLINPLGRMREVGVIYWTGKPGKARLPSQVEPKPQTGDSAFETVALNRQGNSATGTITLPALPAGKTYWIRPYFTNASGKKTWDVASEYRPGSLNGKGSLVMNKKGFLGPGRDTFVDKRGCYFKIVTVRMEAGRTYTIDLESKQFDAYLGLINPDKQVVARDDDGGDGLNARIVFRPLQNGLYRVVVTSFQPRQRGTYSLRVRQN